ncbi:LOW QUALITY PROTEIN: probable ATP-dependent RNA helicase DDX28 [Mesoplodon densirostris]|uniref:LOW QUALITY PROTEIN: probable ATP-dependent RNA helicase DDX28 n=1 Tax=Mesoplodon densirostris TaxID=48708 RepID=UPI0028DCDA07|nr:LOW QUALITY PROTEIN: probable ATP-dependent RNA helicase DDX28 [Mesoplodon densirostris]
MALARQLLLLSLAARLLLAPRRDLTARRPNEPLPVMRIPQALQRRQEEWQSGQRSPPRPVLARPGPLLMSARRPELNQPARLTLGPWEPAPLASRSWRNRRAHGDHFSIERVQHEAPALRNLLPKGSFTELGLELHVLSTLQEAAPEIVRPTTVQLSTISPLLCGRHILYAAETGSGKTLSYMLPLLQRLLGQPSLDPCRIPAPRGLVLVPSQGLAEQVQAVAQPLGSSLDLQVRELGGGHDMRRIRLQLSKQPPADILVATLGALWKALKTQLISLEQLSLVLDEADTLLDESFLELVDYILEGSHIAEGPADLKDPFNPKAQLMLVGATFPEGVGQLLSKFASLDSLTTVTSDKLHCIMPHVRQTFMRPKGTEKMTGLVQILRQHDRAYRTGPAGTVLVFCNCSSTVNWLGYILDDHKIQHLRLQEQMPASTRAGIFQSFQKGSQDILLCTDITSWGLDSTQVELVINYDLPLTLQDYIHRAGGRVGRVGSEVPGTVVSFVTHPWDVSLAQKIELAARQRSLPGLGSSVREPLHQQTLLQQAYI